MKALSKETQHIETVAPIQPMHPSYRGISEMQHDTELQDALGTVERAWAKHHYSYNFSWLGVPIIQIPQDIVALQEIIWRTRPNCIIETGVAHGGSLILSASILRLLGNDGSVYGIDIDIRPHNRTAIQAHPLASMITLIEGSSIDPQIVASVQSLVAGKRVMVILDSNHTHEHVLAELRAYAPLVTQQCYCCVSDTVVERIPSDVYSNRPWGRGDNPMTAVDDFLLTHSEFTIDEMFDHKLGLSMSPRGYLLRS